MPRPGIDDATLLNQVQEIFLAKGYRSVTLTELAKTLRCSRRRFYELADSKEELFYRVAERFFANLRNQGWHAASREPNVADKIGAYLAPGTRAAQRLSPAFIRDIASTKRGQAIFDSHQQQRVDGLRTLIDEGIQKGVFRGVHSYLVADITLYAVRRCRDEDFRRASGLTLAEALSEIYDLLRHGLLHPEAAERESGRPRSSAAPAQSLPRQI